MEITGFVAIGNGESCPYCDLIQGKDFEDAMQHLLKNHEKELSDALNGKTNDEVAGIVENECYFCKKNAVVEGKGVAYTRTQLPSGKWDSVPVCITCLRNQSRRGPHHVGVGTKRFSPPNR